METLERENVSVKETKKPVVIMSALRNELNEYAGPGSDVIIKLMGGTVVEGVIERILYGGDILLKSGVKVNTSKMESFLLNGK